MIFNARQRCFHQEFMNDMFVVCKTSASVQVLFIELTIVTQFLIGAQVVNNALLLALLASRTLPCFSFFGRTRQECCNEALKCSSSTMCITTSVTSKKSPNVYKSCPKMISLEKWKILTPLQKLPKYVDDLGKIIATTSFEMVSKLQ